MMGEIIAAVTSLAGVGCSIIAAVTSLAGVGCSFPSAGVRGRGSPNCVGASLRCPGKRRNSFLFRDRMTSVSCSPHARAARSSG